MQPPAQRSVFISYASENREKADEICAGLEQRGFACWIAPRDVRAGREYADEIIHGLERSASVVLVLSEAANTSVFVLREVERAVSKDINVVPVRIEEVNPSPGLELFISGTHWLDVWRGDWDQHLDRLARDLVDSPADPATSPGFPRRRSVTRPRSLRTVYVAAGLVVVAAVSGIAMWSLSGRMSQQRSLPEDRGAAPVIVTDAPDPAPAIVQEQREIQAAPAGQVDVPPSDAGNRPTRGARRTPARAGGTPTSAPASRDVGVPPARAAADTPGASREASRELNAVRDDYDNLSIRAGVIDEALDQLWEQMKPNSPRLDMATRQRSLRTNMTRSREALADRDAAGARRYLETARGDLEVLEQFLNR